MHPYINEGFFSFLITLWTRFFLFLTMQLKTEDLVSEDLQFLALILSGTLGLLIGFYLVYNRLTMLANSLSHTVLLGLILTFISFRHFLPLLGVDNIPFYLQMIAAALTSSLTLMALSYLSKRLSFEAANAFSFTSLFAIGILFSSVLLKDTHLGIESVLGNLEALSFIDIKRLFIALAFSSILIFLTKTRLNLMSFDALFSRSIGIKPELYRQGLIFISSLALMVCFRSMGVILILSLLTAPILIAQKFCRTQKNILIFGFLFVLFQTSICLGLVQHLYTIHNLSVSTAGLFGFLGLIFYFLLTKMKKAADKKPAALKT